jgi:hypothetical protein
MGFVIIVAMRLYLLISLGVVAWAISHAKKNGKRMRRWGWGAVLLNNGNVVEGGTTYKLELGDANHMLAGTQSDNPSMQFKPERFHHFELMLSDVAKQAATSSP